MRNEEKVRERGERKGRGEQNVSVWENKQNKTRFCFLHLWRGVKTWLVTISEHKHV